MRFEVSRARLAQRLIAEKVMEEDRLPPRVELVGGVDLSYVGDAAVAAAIVINAHTFKPVSKATVVLDVKFPYIPTLLAFREAGPMIVAVRRLSVRPHVLFVDGNGRLHPYRAGLACHVGLALDMPTVGVAKKLLCGELGEWRGREAPVLLGGEVIGMALRAGRGMRPIYVSVGHKITLRTAVRLTKRFTRGRSKLPEPLRLAHAEATALARKLRSGSSL
ncbi:MAG: endonuclease V [Thermoprotei archaeon]|nr:MAG: endonuclease V [Thermoprotei archaeon]RLE96578.1 MAG: endonuclease V [Thermoprotei archaeon]